MNYIVISLMFLLLGFFLYLMADIVAMLVAASRAMRGGEKEMRRFCDLCPAPSLGSGFHMLAKFPHK
jgi:hypothetical protein